jgi:hypothetical protein
MIIYKCRSYAHLDGQPLDEFVIELRKLTKNCQFANTDNEISSAFSRAFPIVNRSSSVLSGSFNALLLSLFDLQFCMTWVNISKGKTYNFCKKHNHFSKVCESRLKREDFQEVKTKEAIIESSSDEEYAYTIIESFIVDRAFSPNS